MSEPTTAEELLARLEAEHGPAVAAVAYRIITGETPPTTRSGPRCIYANRGASAEPHTTPHRR